MNGYLHGQLTWYDHVMTAHDPNRLNARLKSIAYQTLSESLEGQRGGVRVRSATTEVVLVVRGVRQACLTGETRPKGEFFSPAESAIWMALRDGPLSAKALGRVTGLGYSPKFRTILANLVERSVLKKCADGYTRHQ